MVDLTLQIYCSRPQDLNESAEESIAVFIFFSLACSNKVYLLHGCTKLLSEVPRKVSGLKKKNIIAVVTRAFNSLKQIADLF